MSVKWSKAEVRNAVLQLVPELYDTEALEKAKNRIEVVEKGTFHEYNDDIAKAVKKYGDTELTAKDQKKIKAIEKEITGKEQEIATKGNEAVAKYQEQLAKAVESQEFAQIAELMRETQQEKDKTTVKEREAIRVAQKQINALQNKKIRAAEASLNEDWNITRGTNADGTETVGYGIEGERFHIVSPRKSLAYTADAFADPDTRRIWLRCRGEGWPAQMRVPTPWFAGFWLEPDNSHKKNAIQSRTRLVHLVYDILTVCEREKPKSQEDLLEVMATVNKRIELGNMNAKFSAGAENCYRLVEAIDETQKDVGHQRLAVQYVQPDWDNLEEHEATINAMIDAELDQAALDAEENAESEQEEQETAEKAA